MTILLLVLFLLLELFLFLFLLPIIIIIIINIIVPKYAPPRALRRTYFGRIFCIKKPNKNQTNEIATAEL